MHKKKHTEGPRGRYTSGDRKWMWKQIFVENDICYQQQIRPSFYWDDNVTRRRRCTERKVLKIWRTGSSDFSWTTFVNPTWFSRKLAIKKLKFYRNVFVLNSLTQMLNSLTEFSLRAKFDLGSFLVSLAATSAGRRKIARISGGPAVFSGSISGRGLYWLSELGRLVRKARQELFIRLSVGKAIRRRRWRPPLTDALGPTWRRQDMTCRPRTVVAAN